MNDPDQVIRIPKLTLQITILDAEERGYKKAQAEIARLREALEHYESSHYDSEGRPCMNDNTAREALKGGE